MSTETLEVNEIGYTLKRAQHALRLAFDEALRPLKLTTPQYAVLSALEQSPGLSNANLAKLCFVTAQTMHGIISNLEKRDLIKRSSDPVHGRILSAKLTKQGRRLLKGAKVIIKDTETTMTKGIKKTEITLLKKTLLQCVANLSQ